MNYLCIDFEKHWQKASGDIDLYFDLVLDNEVELQLLDKRIKKKYKRKKITQYDAIRVFKSELPAICCEKIKHGTEEEKKNYEKLLQSMRSNDKIDIERAKQQDIEVVCRDLGIDVDRTGKIICPFHEDSRPSCKLYYDTNTFYCFSCNTYGDVIKLVEKMKGVTFVEAVRYLN